MGNQGLKLGLAREWRPIFNFAGRPGPVVIFMDEATEPISNEIQPARSFCDKGPGKTADSMITSLLTYFFDSKRFSNRFLGVIAFWSGHGTIGSFRTGGRSWSPSQQIAGIVPFLNPQQADSLSIGKPRFFLTLSFSGLERSSVWHPACSRKFSEGYRHERSVVL
jgi:hypothetical protein